MNFRTWEWKCQDEWIYNCVYKTNRLFDVHELSSSRDLIVYLRNLLFILLNVFFLIFFTNVA